MVFSQFEAIINKTTLHILVHFPWCPFAHISIWYKTGVECGMLGHRACMSASVVDDATVSHSGYTNLHSHDMWSVFDLVYLFHVSPFDGYQFSAFPFDFCVPPFPKEFSFVSQGIDINIFTHY